MSLQPKVHQGEITAEGFRFAIVASRWTESLVAKLIDGAVEALEEHGAAEGSIEIFRVPGAFELPLAAKKVAESKKWDAVICLGVVIRGGTPHFDYVAGAAATGSTQASLETGIPVLFGVITADNVQQAVDRSGKRNDNKGFEAAMAAIEVVNLYKEIT
ncbi:MAG TPA: 6,7-dimethyl-8-ribityllumazine synthase [Pyrinomonadaceae bacterium]|jgi:6,7-dimethyl-8-ribityllumazine synthase|nr:6,7-dimethyl-8-ribityllumazine synthase [Pyrinomonadaceae bacterium]